ncbi:MAG: ROK family protein [Hydrogenophaga sp.]|uniref:ROK family protein n=1 Tax=Hydrogenophaga aromaticivorans TaxID=2610898 RepID=A0A7Y8H173_9BURK|nr:MULTISPECIES: ROK family protein [Hydrogenophaga]PKO78863.1 MAG: serine/threonine protein kinase [Betaproteobacteria bacterium HGW-Betaproteobacteria-15]MBQ0921093.1 ROK family protein [Hydrogenophaga aromaticivorans]MDO9032207.1 ROK family protein [Hydrogenophaga sp.]MDO9291910.1 ROK family protein [Hydrogenophaga sp.]MDZ4292394.1 ROK family protein [Hydrogenophaga sp.]
MRQFNERVVLQTLRAHGSLAKADLARLTGLTAQTIGLITARLDEDQLLNRGAPVRGRVGQPSVPLGLNPDGAFAIGIKIGRRSADWLLVDFTGRVRERLVLDYAFPDIPVLLPAIKSNLNRLLDGLGPLRDRVVGVGVAAPFQLGGWHRMLGLTEAQSLAWNQIDLVAEVQALTDLPISFAKDTSAACVAELLQGKGRDIRSFLYLFLDTFVGGGLVLNSHLHRGVNGNAGAVASLPLQVATADMKELPPQLISQASLWDLEQRFREHALDPMAAYDARALEAPWLPYTREWVARAALALAHCIVAGTAFLDVEAVVIDGVVAPDLLRKLWARTGEALKAYNWEGLQQMPRLEIGSIGSDARALGGALLPLHACFAPDHEIFLKS